MKVAIYGAALAGECAYAALTGWGAGAYNERAVVYSKIDENRGEVVCFIDDDPMKRGKKLFDLPIYSWEEFKKKESATKIVLAVQNLGKAHRLKIRDKVREWGGELVTVHEQGSRVEPSASIGAGTYVKAGAVVSHHSVVGEACILDTGCMIGHHNLVKDGCHIGMGAVLESKVVISHLTVVGANSVVVHGATIGRESLIFPNSVIENCMPALTCHKVGMKGMRTRPSGYCESAEAKSE